MEPAWTQFESSQRKKVNLVMVNVDQQDKAEFKKYAKIIESNESIPATVWLDNKGKILQSKVGKMTAKELEVETSTLLKKVK